ncbi:MAG TPA: peptidoglycan DD-metalloendopeptidase family protein [Anaerolineaceae bacterium]|nr:peptidoglycan DD-metalloendopeptidase family protein [Anaerolineaceae bacterium]
MGPVNPMHWMRLMLGLSMLLSLAFAGTVNSAAVSPERDAPEWGGGGEAPLPQTEDLSETQRHEIQTTVEQNIQRLGLQRPAAPFTTVLAWPVRAAGGLSDPGYHGLSAFVDHNLAYPDQLQDYACGTRTYDLASGVNHEGTDIFSWPFGWYKMDHNEVEVVAAAPGTIVYRQDGNFDRSCGINSNPANAVAILHADGSTAWYLHLKKDSVTAKPVGAAVVSGEYLGVMGSSGASTGPHLHFALYDSGGNWVDPFNGPCNAIPSWWAAQKPYYDSAINKLTTGLAPPVFPDCPVQETSNARRYFNPGEKIYYTVYYRDQLAGQSSSFTVFRPDGTVSLSWSHASSAAHYAAAYWYWYATLAADAQPGLWTFRAVYNGRTYFHRFSVGDPVTLSVQPVSGTANLAWEVYADLPATSTWQITYSGPAGSQPSPITGISHAVRNFSLSGLTNGAMYTITLNAVVNAQAVTTDTVSVMPSDKLIFLPVVAKNAPAAGMDGENGP